jgi:hypothetical protein
MHDVDSMAALGQDWFTVVIDIYCFVKGKELEQAYKFAPWHLFVQPSLEGAVMDIT